MPGLICMEASASGSIIQGTDVRSLRLLRGAVPPPQLMSGDQPSGSTPGMGPSAVYSQRRSGPKKRSSGVRLRRYAQYSASNSKSRRSSTAWASRSWVYRRRRTLRVRCSGAGERQGAPILRYRCMCACHALARYATRSDGSPGMLSLLICARSLNNGDNASQWTTHANV